MRHAFSAPESDYAQLPTTDTRQFQKLAIHNVSNKCINALRQLWKVGLESCPTRSFLEYIQKNAVSSSDASINCPLPRFLAKCIVTAINQGVDISLYELRDSLCYELFASEQNDMILDISGKSLSAFLIAYQSMRSLSFASQVLNREKMW